MMVVRYPDEKSRSLEEIQRNSRLLRTAARFLGIDPDEAEFDICEDGSAYDGLTQVLPKGSIEINLQQED